MKRLLLPVITGLIFLLLTGCADGAQAQSEILINIRESEGFSVEENGLSIRPGEDAVFLLHMKDGVAVSGADYDGIYDIEMADGMTRITLKNVAYPDHISLRTTSDYALITYVPNGGSGEERTLIHDTANHLRPNTDNGQGLFVRDGYTLTSWNTMSDGSGERIGLGSRVHVPEEGLTLYAQWTKWSDEKDFDWTTSDEGVTITGYRGSDDIVSIPGRIDDMAVTAIASGAFTECMMKEVILPPDLMVVEENAFQNCTLEKLVLFDNIESVSDASFSGCDALKTLYINAVEKPYGYNYRRESCYADKVELLIQAQNERKIVFYGGCSTWYNLDSDLLEPLTAQGYQVINMGINGLTDSAVQMQIIGHFLEPGDIFFHAPELSSKTQMLVTQNMNNGQGDKLWCGLEYNYDLFTLVDLRSVSGALDSLQDYLSIKKSGTDYSSVFTKDGNSYCDAFGCIPFLRTETGTSLPDEVYMNTSFITDKSMERLQEFYDQYQGRGAHVYVSYASVNMDAVPEEERNNVGMVEQEFSKAIAQMDGPVLISRLTDYLYSVDAFYDTNYHLRSETARTNTERWLRDLQRQMELDGLWEEP